MGWTSREKPKGNTWFLRKMCPWVTCEERNPTFFTTACLGFNISFTKISDYCIRKQSNPARVLGWEMCACGTKGGRERAFPLKAACFLRNPIGPQRDYISKDSLQGKKSFQIPSVLTKSFLSRSSTVNLCCLSPIHKMIYTETKTCQNSSYWELLLLPNTNH